MISKLSNRITRNLLKRNVISDEEKELYDYGLFMMISYIAYFLISMLFGVVLKIPFSALIFYISFCLVRNYAGGVHANSEIKCTVLTTVSIFISEILIKIFIDYNLVTIAFIILIVSSICLCVLKPVSTSQKEISQQQKIYFHKKVIMLVVLFLIISTISFMFGVYSTTISLSIGSSLANILFLTGKFVQMYQKSVCSEQC